MKEGNVLQQKTYQFSIRIVKAYQYLVEVKKSMFFLNNC